MTTRVMAGIQNTYTKRKLLALSPFPTSQQAINLCRSEESAKANMKSLSNLPAVSYVQTKDQRPFRPSETGRCGSCGRSTHCNGEPCPAIGKQFHNCGENNHFSPCCPKKPKSESTNGGGAKSGGGNQKGTHSGNKQGEHSDRSRVHMKRIFVGNVRAHRRHRPAPTIPVQLRDSTGKLLTTITKTIPDGGAEATVGRMYVLRDLG
jgi:hypothetical protein